MNLMMLRPRRLQRGGLLHLSGLTSLSDIAAEALAKHQGDLELSGLTSLSDFAAEAFAGTKDLLDSAAYNHFETSQQTRWRSTRATSTLAH
jgi:hypothetical protein